MKYKSMPFEVKADVDERIIKGYASTWKKDLVNDQIVQGAFKKTISERFPKGKIKVLWQHVEPLGMPTVIEEDSKGLYVEAKISKTRLGDDALELMRDGVVDEMSIGYDVLEDSLGDDGSTRFLKELQLFEFSPVTFGANPYTSIDDVKQLEAIEYKTNALATMLKEGRSISGANLERIKRAVSELSELLDDEADDDDKGAPAGTFHRKSEPEAATALNNLFSLAQDIKTYKKERV